MCFRFVFMIKNGIIFYYVSKSKWKAYAQKLYIILYWLVTTNPINRVKQLCFPCFF